MAQTAPFQEKLTEEQRTQVCHWIAQFQKPLQITQRIKDEFGISVSRLLVYKYQRSPKWKPLIERLRQQWAQDVMAIPIAHKKDRLERLMSLWEKAETLPPKDQQQQQLAVVREAREEMTETKGMAVTVINSIMQVPDEELWSRREQLVKHVTTLGGSHALRRDREHEAPRVEDDPHDG